jgi:hypothetical protein
MTMPRNGTRRPPRPKIELVTETASRTEAAAIVAALEQFLAETAPAPPAAGPAPSRWQQAALHEAISAGAEHGPPNPAPGDPTVTNRRTEWP